MAIILRDSSPEKHIPLSYNRTFARGRDGMTLSRRLRTNLPFRPYNQDKLYESERAQSTTSGQQKIFKKYPKDLSIRAV